LSGRLIVISPGDLEMSVGLNPLGEGKPDFVSIAEIAELLKMYWGLDRFGARTDELLRNALFVLAANGLTLLELSPLLTHPGSHTRSIKISLLTRDGKASRRHASILKGKGVFGEIFKGFSW
jgi:hypothetical protein